jgi:hypothetical protein
VTYDEVYKLWDGADDDKESESDPTFDEEGRPVQRVCFSLVTLLFALTHSDLFIY